MMKNMFTYTQILLVVCMTLCNGGIAVCFPGKSEEFPCKGHQCGCRSESDCRAHCCCKLNKDLVMFQDNVHGRKNGLHVVISGVNCKYGDSPLKGIIFTVKYILEVKVQSEKEFFLCFFSHDTSIRIPEMSVSPPEKPPRDFT